MNEISPKFDVEQLNTTLQEVADSRTQRQEKKYFCKDSKGKWVAKTNSEIIEDRKHGKIFIRLSIEEISLLAKNTTNKEKFNNSEKTPEWHSKVINISNNIKQLNQERMNKNEASLGSWGKMLITALVTNVFCLFTIVLWNAKYNEIKSSGTIVNDALNKLAKESENNLLRIKEQNDLGKIRLKSAHDTINIIKNIQSGNYDDIDQLNDKNIIENIKSLLFFLKNEENKTNSEFGIKHLNTRLLKIKPREIIEGLEVFL